MGALPGSLPEGWYIPEAEKAEELHAELQKELPPGHPLFRVQVEVVGYREGTDDILCRHKVLPERFTVIHLSWLGKQEINTKHPCVEDDGNFESFLRYEAGFYRD